MAYKISDDSKKFLETQEVAVLSTLSRSAQVQGATVYYRLRDDCIYILTKSDSSKAHNMMAHNQVALTIYNPDEIKTVQLEGIAQIEADRETKRIIFDELVKPRDYQGEKLMPPVTELSAGGFITFRIQPTKVIYTNYKNIKRAHSPLPTKDM
jgi:nitroimidazol reductase NimA-like FMN-containing flavoprotein (pyridoxamine 5'-phosphate oxidase superfamily)